MKPYYLLVGVLLAVSACGSHTTTSAQAIPRSQVVASGTDYSYIYSEMATSGSCRTNMSAGGGLSAKCN